MSQSKFKLSTDRSGTFEGIPEDFCGFRQGKGVTHIMVLSCRGDYSSMFKIIKDDHKQPILGLDFESYMDEVQDSKWLIHAYDLVGMLN